MTVLSVGEMVIDFLPGDEAGVYIRKAGGAPANVAIALARQGVDTLFCGMMGNDDFGHFLMDTLTDNNVFPCVKELTDEATTTMAFVTLSESGNRSFTFARKPGADMLLTKDHVKDEYIDRADVIHCGSCSMSKGTAAEATCYALQEGHRRGKLVSFDVNYRDLMWDGDKEAAVRAVEKVLSCIDLLKISDEEADMIGGEECFEKVMRDNDIALIVETLGSKGARCYWNGMTIDVDGIETKCVDSCGAGDAFWGGFLSSLLREEVCSVDRLNEEVIREAMRCGNIAGWLCVQKKGAIESLPVKEDVLKHRKKFYN